jgi:hypothetical protein
MLGTLFPELCNQQGDQGFLDVCQQLGITARVVTTPDDLEGLTFLYVGDSSRVGQRLLANRVQTMVPQLLSLVEEGAVLFCIGRSALAMAELMGLASIAGSGRVSHFVSVLQDGQELLGYVNGAYSSVFDSQPVGSGWFVQTALLGPALVINPDMRNSLFEKAGLPTRVVTELEGSLRDHYRKEI